MPVAFTAPAAEDRELVFFDPDNGLEVTSVSPRRRGSSKYLYWTEAERTYADGHSLLIYQHFPREERGAFVRRAAEELCVRTGAEAVHSFCTSYVVFFLVPHPEHSDALRRGIERVAGCWDRQIAVV